MKGGAVTVLRHLEDRIPDAKSFEKQVDILYLSAHGETTFDSITIVPENTFVAFMGISGFMRYIGIHEFPNFSPLLCPDYIDVTKGSSRPGGGNTTQHEEYFQRIYDNYITGRTDEYVPYEYSMIYVPGDILPNMNFTFASDSSTVWAKGLYTLPVDFAMAKALEPGYDENAYIIRVLEMKDRGKITEDELDKAGVLPERKVDFDALVLLGTSEERIAYLKTTYGSKWYTFLWFAHPDVIQPEVNLEQFNYPSNQLNTPEFIEDEIPIEDLNIELSRIFNDIKDYSMYGTKPYKLLIIGSCRGPIGVRSEYENALKKILISRYTQPVAGNLPREVEPLRRLARQFSFSSKQELCASPDEPTFSVLPLHPLLERIRKLKSLTATYTSETRDDLPSELFRNINYFFRLRYGADILNYKLLMSPFATFLSLLVYPYPVLETTDERFLPLKVLVEDCLRIGRQQFGPFIVQLREFFGATVPASVSIGDLLRSITGIPIRSKTTSEERNTERTALRNLRTAMSVPQRNAKEEEERSEYTKMLYEGVDNQINYLSDETKKYSKLFRQAMNTLESNTNRTRERELLPKLRFNRDLFNDIYLRFVPNLEALFAPYQSAVYPKLITFITHANKVIRQFTELKEEMDQLVQNLESRQTKLNKLRRQSGTRKLIPSARKTRKSRREKLV